MSYDNDSMLDSFMRRCGEVDVTTKPHLLCDPFTTLDNWCVVFTGKHHRETRHYGSFRNACLGARELYNYWYFKIGDSENSK